MKRFPTSQTKPYLLGLGMFVFLAVLACGQRMDHGGSVGAYAYGDHRSGVPNWELDEELPHDKFTFARVIFTSTSSWSWRRIDRWTIDYPESDLNFSFRLQQMTAMKVDPDGVLLELTDPKLFDYPFIYMVEPGFLLFSEAEVKALRTYLLNGGFLMVDDFWGEDEWENFRLEIKRVFPEKEAIEITLDHEIFNTVFPLKKTLDKLPQIPNVGQAIQGRRQGITWERWDAQEPHYRIIKDDLDRIMVMICHNTDLGDGWEEEARNHWYFREFSEKKAYPLGINIIFYAMTH